MSKILTFADGQTFTATDTSTIYTLKAAVSSFADIDPEWTKFTQENLVSCDFDGTAYTDIIPVGVSAERTGTNVLMTVSCRDISQAEIIQKQAEQIAELQEAVAELG